MRGLTAMIPAKYFFWCAVTPISACKHCKQYLCTQPTLPTRRGKNMISPGNTELYLSRDLKKTQKRNLIFPGHICGLSRAGEIQSGTCGYARGVLFAIERTMRAPSKAVKKLNTHAIMTGNY